MLDEPDTIFHIVRNEEEQYSIWPVDLPVPRGWQVVGGPSGKDACLRRIEELWTDIRPLSLRRSHNAAAGGIPEA